MDCERLKCKTSVETCINRQHVATPTRFSQCVDCPQGKKVIADFKRRGKKPEPDIEKLKETVLGAVLGTSTQSFTNLNEVILVEEETGARCSASPKTLKIPALEEPMDKKPKQQEEKTEEKRQLPDMRPEGIVTVDFRRRPEVWTWLKQMADEDERTVEKELLYLARECREQWQKKQEKAA